MKPSHVHIPLGRQFGDLDGSQGSEVAALESYMRWAKDGSPDASWSGIYQDGRSCVLLGEPGSGKSEELKEQAELMRSSGKPAAYVDLRSLLSDVTPYLDDEDALIKAWRRSDAIAWFFLDSVDESKLEHVSDFHRALKQMAKWVAPHAARARYVISSRVSEWRGATDGRWVEEQLLSNAPRPPHDQPLLRVLTLLPLTNEQARIFQAAGGLADEAFFEAVEQADAWEFLRRPLDVTDLYALWQRRSRLGTLTEVVENSIERLLKEPRERSSLSASMAKEGAEQLAACLAFGKSVSLMPSDAVLPDPAGALMLRDCLPKNWTETDCAQILQRPLFDAAAYGKVRFHHRTYQDFLACSWLAKQMRADLPLSELRHLLFSEGANGMLTLRPSLASVAAWLACVDAEGERWQEHHRRDLLNAAPWVFFSHGDPKRLPSDYKVDVLQKTVERFQGRKRVRIELDAPTLKRFADPLLAPTLSAWIVDEGVATSLRDDFIELVRHGKIAEAVPSVVVTALSEVADEDLRATALYCIADVGTTRHRNDVVDAFRVATKIPLRVGVPLVRLAYPHVIDENELFTLLARLDVASSRSRSSALHVLDGYIERKVPSERVPALLDHLQRFLRDEQGTLHPTRGWAADWLAPLVIRLLSQAALTPFEQQVALGSLELLAVATVAGLVRSLRGDEEFTAIAEASSRHPGLRRAWYWRKVERFRAIRHEEPSSIWNLDHHDSPLKWMPQDTTWWAEDVRVRERLEDRVFALRVVLSAWTMTRQGRPLIPSLAVVKAGMGEPLLRKQLGVEVLDACYQPSTGFATNGDPAGVLGTFGVTSSGPLFNAIGVCAIECISGGAARDSRMVNGGMERGSLLSGQDAMVQPRVAVRMTS